LNKTAGINQNKNPLPAKETIKRRRLDPRNYLKPTCKFDATLLFYLYSFLASNAGSVLFISRNEKPNTKTRITTVDGGFPTGQYEYNR